MENFYVFFLHEWQIPEPAYYFLDQIKAHSPQEILQPNLPHLAQRVRELLEIDEDDMNADTIEESLYIVRASEWLSSREVHWRASISGSNNT